MTLPLSNLVVAALAVGGLATGVGTASAATTSPRAAQITAEQAQEQQLRGDIDSLTTTEQHLQATLRNRTAKSSGAPQAASSAPQNVTRSSEYGNTTAGTWGSQPTNAPAENGGGTWSGPPRAGGGPSSTTTEPTEPTEPTTEPTEPTTTLPPPPTTTTTRPDRGGDGGRD